MKASKTAKYKVVPMNIKNGNTAPYFIIEPEAKAKRDAIEKTALETFKKTGLGKFSNWSVNVEKI